MNEDFSGKTAIVTGGSRGIGFSIVKALIDCGAQVLCTATRDLCEYDKLSALYNASQGRLHYAKCDCANKNDRSALFFEANKIFGRLDLFVSNAGIAPRVRRDLLEVDEESYDEVMGVNLKGAFFLAQKASVVMEKQKSGMMIFVTSCSAETVSVNRGEYCISKAGLSMAAKLFAARLAASNIAVYEIRPGIIKTDMTASVTEKYDALIASGLVLQKRWGFPEDVSNAVKALFSGALPYSTGQIINVDGGMTIDIL